MTALEDCNICCLEVSPSKIVECLACEFKACKDCQKRYINDSNQLAHCMNCRAAYNLKFLYEAFTKTWVNKGYRDHTKEIVLDREKSRIPETLAILPRIRAERDRQKKYKQLLERKSELMAELDEVKKQIDNYRYRRWDTDGETGETGEGGQKAAEKQEKKIHFLCPCPIEECRGMIESRSFQCGVCDQKVCRRCRSIKNEGDDHVCNEDDIENLKLIRKDTRPCPNCAVPIYKIQGCDQMYCTICRTAFSWRTGKIETGLIHNPHAIAWQRQNGEQIRDIREMPCGGMIQLRQLYTKAIMDDKEKKSLVDGVYQFTGELTYILNNCTLRDFDDLRQEYVLGEITEDKWKQKIFIRVRANARRSAVRDAVETIRTLLIERIRNLGETFAETMSKKKHLEAYEKFAADVVRIREFINDILMTELPPLGTKSPIQILDTWRWNKTYNGT